ncbi:MAG: FAD-dependent oxidoreductase [Betaproteobacteria bacterium]|nr:MAG: FAD-dependent oxidoreductase [Betaproteobacteria bacterium]
MEDLDHGVNVAVIGAGWAGMAAAVTLAQTGTRVTVFEAARHLGGRARTVELEGIDLDNGQHILIGAYVETLRLMRAVGADPKQLLLRQQLAIEYPGAFRLRAPRLPAPLHLLAALMTANGLAWTERIAAMRFMTAMRGNNYRIAADMPVAELLAQHRQGGALARYLWEPLCVSALNTPAAAASAQTFLNVVRDGLDGPRANSDFLIPRTDLGRLFPLPAADFVRDHGGSIRLGTPVRALTESADGFVLDTGPERYSHVILAVAPHQLDVLLDCFPALAAVRQSIVAFAYEPIYTCYLQYPPSVTMPQPMTGFDGGSIQWIFDRGRINGTAGLLAAVISARGAHQDFSQDALAEAIHRELVAFLPDIPSPLWSRVIAEKRATFSCRPGIARPSNRTPVDRLYLAGDYTASDYPATLESAVRSGVRAAGLVRLR